VPDFAGIRSHKRWSCRLIVLNRGKRLVGIVSLGDLAAQGDEKVAGKALEAVSQEGGPEERRKPPKRNNGRRQPKAAPAAHSR
jgi:hypothetical protein